jgi:DNA mismatch endonuclease (patch repair protein)
MPLGPHPRPTLLTACPPAVGRPRSCVPRLRKVIFVSGCFWHRHTCGRCRIPATRRAYWVAKIDRNAARDKRVQRALRRLGWGVLVVWECQAQPRMADRLRARLRAFLDKPSP